MFKDIKFDFEKNAPVFEGGLFVFTEGKEAVKSWAYRQLMTQRYAHKIYPRSNGNEMFRLVGKPFTKAVKEKENREIECLANNPKFPGTYMRYVAKDTLYFPIYRYKIYNKILNKTNNGILILDIKDILEEN